MTSAEICGSLKRQCLLLVAGLATLSCVPQAFELSDFKKHLTADEKSELAAGHPINKLHSSYWVMHPNQLYWEGPLHIQPLPTGKLKFTPFGHWMQYDEHGGLLCESNYTISSVGSAGRSRMYYPAGFLQMVTEGRPVLLDGDSVLMVRLVQFKAGNETDTAYVEKRWAKDGKTVRPAVRSFDWQGKRPVPKK
jgi:hypothetical protein